MSLLLICVREAIPLVRAVAQEGSGGTVAATEPRVPLSSAFTFQGRIEDSGLPLDGQIDLQFQLFSDAAGTVAASGTTSIGNASVTNGVFSEWLDFGNAFTGERRWISVSARPFNSTGAYTSLGLQELTATPYATFSAHTAFGQFISGNNNTYGMVLSQEGSGNALTAQNTGTGDAIYAVATEADSYAVRAYNGVGPAIYADGAGVGIATYGDIALSGYSSAPGYGAVFGQNNVGYGVVGDSLDVNYAGVLGRNPNGAGVKGTGTNGVVGVGQNGVLGTATTRGTGGTYGISYAGGDCALTSNATKCYGAIGYSGAPNGAGVGVYGNGTWAGLYGLPGVAGAWAAFLDGKVFIGSIIDGPAGNITSVNLQPDVDGVRNLGFASRKWNAVVAEDMFSDGYHALSDGRLKTDVAALPAGLDLVRQLRPVSFRWTDDHDGGQQHLGLIAQEVQEVLPGLVTTMDDGDTLTISSMELIPVLIKAIQELQVEVEALKAGQ